MESINRVELYGRAVADAKLRFTGRGTPVANVSIATTRWVTVANGERKEMTEWHNLVAWSDLAKQIGEARKGDWLHVRGRIQSRSWEGHDGQKRRTTEIITEEVIPVDGRKPATAAVEEEVPWTPAK